MKTSILKVGVLSALSLFVGMLGAFAPPPPTQLSYVPESFDYDPPVPQRFFVTKLAAPLDSGENLMMRVEFEPRDSMPAILPVYLTDRDSVQFRDDGVAPDVTPDDYSYAAYVEEEITAFIAEMASIKGAFDDQGYLLRFTGHAGEQVNTLPAFNTGDFNNGLETEISRDIVWVKKPWCGWAKEKTLFITDLAVVEDKTRTYDVFDETGTQMGAWTFGKLIQNIVNTSSTGKTAKEFLESWLLQWTQPQAINNQTVAAREGIVQHLIEPWLRKCDQNINVGDVSLGNWTSKWNQSSVSEADLLKYAPFKLTAIVNRLDLRAGHVYRNTLSNSGETRFIFTALNPYLTKKIGSYNGSPSQRPPQSDDPGDLRTIVSLVTQTLKEQPEVVDWQGFNVIFEYGNVAATHCQLQQLAESWVSLDAMTLGSSGFNNALQTITDQVTTANAKPTWANGSAIRSIRTNERVFALLSTNPNPGYCGHGPGSTQVNLNATWQLNDWELRQFGLNPTTHLLEQVVVENTPVSGTNCQGNLTSSGSCGYVFCTLDNTAPELANWVVTHKTQVALGRHKLPATLPGQISMLGASAIVSGDFAHYHDIDWSALSSPPANHRMLRQQLSLNTCGGCHAGETRTMFAHVLPTVSGESAKYWQTNAPPDTKQAVADFKNSPSNANGQFPFPVQAYQHWVKVSAFLTGRNYSGLVGALQSPPSYDDDDPTDINDDNMDGLFRVIDPALLSPASPDTSMFGYNDLERRRLDLCNLVNSDCEPGPAPHPPVLEIIEATSFHPFFKGAH